MKAVLCGQTSALACNPGHPQARGGNSRQPILKRPGQLPSAMSCGLSFTICFAEAHHTTLSSFTCFRWVLEQHSKTAYCAVGFFDTGFLPLLLSNGSSAG